MVWTCNTGPLALNKEETSTMAFVFPLLAMFVFPLLAMTVEAYILNVITAMNLISYV